MEDAVPLPSGSLVSLPAISDAGSLGEFLGSLMDSASSSDGAKERTRLQEHLLEHEALLEPLGMPEQEHQPMDIDPEKPSTERTAWDWPCPPVGLATTENVPRRWPTAQPQELVLKAGLNGTPTEPGTQIQGPQAGAPVSPDHAVQLQSFQGQSGSEGYQQQGQACRGGVLHNLKLLQALATSAGPSPLPSPLSTEPSFSLLVPSSGIKQQYPREPAWNPRAPSQQLPPGNPPEQSDDSVSGCDVETNDHCSSSALPLHPFGASKPQSAYRVAVMSPPQGGLRLQSFPPPLAAPKRAPPLSPASEELLRLLLTQQLTTAVSQPQQPQVNSSLLPLLLAGGNSDVTSALAQLLLTQGRNNNPPQAGGVWPPGRANVQQQQVARSDQAPLGPAWPGADVAGLGQGTVRGGRTPKIPSEGPLWVAGSLTPQPSEAPTASPQRTGGPPPRLQSIRSAPLPTADSLVEGSPPPLSRCATLPVPLPPTFSSPKRGPIGAPKRPPSGRRQRLSLGAPSALTIPPDTPIAPPVSPHTPRLGGSASPRPTEAQFRVPPVVREPPGSPPEVIEKRPVSPSEAQKRRKGRATDPHSHAERVRREKINERMRELQSLVPNSGRLDKVSQLNETIEYVKFLQVQIKVLTLAASGQSDEATDELLRKYRSDLALKDGGGVEVPPGMTPDELLQQRELCLVPVSAAQAAALLEKGGSAARTAQRVEEGLRNENGKRGA